MTALPLAIANANEIAGRWVSEPLTWCTKCPHAHDQSASCAAVANARRLGLRRAHLENLLVRKGRDHDA